MLPGAPGSRSCNSGLVCLFPLARVRHLASTASDHCPIVLRWRDDNLPARKKKQFKYEVMWETHNDFSKMLADSWQGKNVATTLSDLQAKLSDVAGQLGSWERRTFGDVHNELKKLKLELVRAQADPQRVGPSHGELKTIERINELHHREEIMWRQRSRLQWLAAGDKNTRFFHLRVTRRRKRNRITRLTRSDGQVTTDEMEMGEMTSSFYQTLYRSEGISNMEQVLDTVPCKVTALKARRRLRCSKCSPPKRLGLTGFQLIFFNVTGRCVGAR